MAAKKKVPAAAGRPGKATATAAPAEFRRAGAKATAPAGGRARPSSSTAARPPRGGATKARTTKTANSAVARRKQPVRNAAAAKKPRAAVASAGSRRAKTSRTPARGRSTRAENLTPSNPMDSLPESYGENRLRLLARDPHTLYAFWDVDAGERRDLRAELGERGAALSRLTLRVGGEGQAPAVTVMVPEGARSYYLPAEPWRPAFRAELGFTLPSGEFRLLASSNVISLPPAGPSSESATERVRFDPAAPPPEGSLPLPSGARPVAERQPAAGVEGAAAPRGGASDLFRR